ncbi:MAG: hypothetical protein IJC88_01340 [Oscillospiraceae bacterium]|nr:hypothetical protein [Oscillospiraceae bacterium]
MKKYLALILALVMAFSLVACEKEVEEPVVEDVPREAIAPTPAPVLVGNYTLTAEYLPFDAPIILDVSGDPDMDVLGDKVYISNGDTEVKVFTLSGNALTFDKTISVEDTGDEISVDNSGKLYVDGGVFEATVVDPATGATGEAVASGYLSASKTANFALTYFTGRETITAIKDGAASDWMLEGAAGIGAFESISNIEINGDTVLLAGADAENNILGAFDLSGNRLMLSTGSLAGSLPNACAKTANGYVSSSVNQMTFVNADGSIIGEADAKELCGITDDSMWIYEMTPVDGGFLVLAQLYRTGVTGDEIVLFKVSGF